MDSKKRKLGKRRKRLVKKFRRLDMTEDLREKDNVIKVAVPRRRGRKIDLIDDRRYYDDWVPTSLDSYEESLTKLYADAKIWNDVTRNLLDKDLNSITKRSQNDKSKFHHTSNGRSKNVNGRFVTPLSNFIDAPLKTLFSLPSKLGSGVPQVDEKSQSDGKVDYHSEIVKLFEKKDYDSGNGDRSAFTVLPTNPDNHEKTKIYNTQYSVTLNDQEGTKPVMIEETSVGLNDDHRKNKNDDIHRQTIFKRQASSHVPNLKTREMDKKTPNEFLFK